MRVVITYQDKGDDSYLPLIDMAFKSAKRLGYHTVTVGNLDAGDEHIPFDADREKHLMNWVLAAQLAYIESDMFDQPTVLFSPDALFVKAVDDVFTGFDIAFTTRANPRWPINNGVIYLNHKNKDKIAEFWKSCLKTCRNYPLEIQDWYGDQQSLYDVLQSGKHSDINITTLPCEIYNHSPHSGYINDNDLKNAYILHFKGKRKNLTSSYWGKICQK
jgi:hypothetical protein